MQILYSRSWIWICNAYKDFELLESTGTKVWWSKTWYSCCYLLPLTGCGTDLGAPMHCDARYHHRLLRHHFCCYWHVWVSSTFLDEAAGKSWTEIWFLYIFMKYYYLEHDVSLYSLLAHKFILYNVPFMTSTKIIVLCCLLIAVVHVPLVP